jgi:tetratricopeptide (TPR) repeat protein
MKGPGLRSISHNSFYGWPGFQRHILTFFVLLVFTAGVGMYYGNTLGNGFIHDDHGQVETNTYIQSVWYLPKVFTSCIWESAVGNCKQTYYYRPLQSLSYLLTYQISSKPWVFHLVNLIYFTIDVFLVFLLIRTLTKNIFIAVTTAILFLIHPVNNEVVNWVATVPELLYVLFVVLCVLSYIRYREKNNPGNLIGVYIFYALGICAKEPAVFTPFLFLFLDLVYFKKSIARLLRWNNLKPYVICTALFAFYMVLRFWVLGGLGADPSYRVTVPQRIYIFIDLFGSYVRKVIWPHPLNLFYTYHPTYRILTARFVSAALLLVGTLVLAIVAIKKRWKEIGFALVWFVIFLTPSLIFITSIGENLFAERHVFASTIGFAFLVALLLARLWKQRVLGKIAVFGIIGGLCFASWTVIYPRNLLWHDDERMYQDTLTKSPDADLIRSNLAVLYRDSGDIAKAKEQFDIIAARGTWRGMYEVYNNLGDLAQREKKYDEAVQYFNKSIAANPFHKNALNNLGAMYLEQGDILKSLTYLCQANRIDPSFQPANTNIGVAVGMVQKMDDKTFTILFDSILTGNIFHLTTSSSNSIILKKKDCTNPQGCLLTLAATVPKNEFFFPFLIAGKTDSGALVRTRYIEFRQQQGEILVGIDRQFGATSLRLTIPTCDSAYYQVDVPAK